MLKSRLILLIGLLLLNAMVLLGQLWPAGAPPFADKVNIATAIANIAFLLTTLVRFRASKTTI